jgi:hypothetical protein
MYENLDIFGNPIDDHYDCVKWERVGGNLCNPGVFTRGDGIETYEVCFKCGASRSWTNEGESERTWFGKFSATPKRPRTTP